MRFLIDTHILLWALGKPQKLPQHFLELVDDPTNEVVFSAVNIWEIAIKYALGRHDFEVSPREILVSAIESGFIELPVYAGATVHLATMSFHHRDPFDRLLIAQAMSESIPLYTADSELKAYSELVELV